MQTDTVISGHTALSNARGSIAVMNSHRVNFDASKRVPWEVINQFDGFPARIADWHGGIRVVGHRHEADWL